MNGIIKQIEKHQELFQRISANIYLTAIKRWFSNSYASNIIF